MPNERRSYQARVDDWLQACFSEGDGKHKAERTHRFLEESLELAQANECSREDALALVNYVYSRPVGLPELEVGGVMVTMATLCTAIDVDMETAGEAELKRNWSRIDAIKTKRLSKPLDSPLPE